jgi:hypothetical protein
MSHRHCPKCAYQGRLLKLAVVSLRVEYFRCDDCGHVWTHRKGDSEAPPEDVTVKEPEAD